MLRSTKYPAHIQKQIDAAVGPTKTTHKFKVGPKERRTTDGITFGSIWEKDAYLLLKGLVGVERIELQTAFEVFPAYIRFDGKKIRAIRYLADFVIDGVCVIDTKGVETDVFKMKKKMFEQIYGKPLHTLKNSGNSWQNLENLKTIIEL